MKKKLVERESSELLAFADEGPVVEEKAAVGTWNILVVDDEEEVHAVTKLALSDFRFAGGGLQFHSAYSGAQAKRMLRDIDGIAVVLLDVVMEDEHAGLEVVRYIRQELHNPFIRIILRTGQPGQAPERQVVQDYDINDYKEKTELTSQKLFTCVFTALGNYRALTGLDANRRGLVKVIEASASIFEQQSLERFIQGVMEQVGALLFVDKEMVYVKNIGIARDLGHSQQRILAATGDEHEYVGRDPREVLPPEVNEQVQLALQQRRTLLDTHSFTGYLQTRMATEAVIYVSSPNPLQPPDRNLLELFFRNATIGLENLYLRQDIEETQQEIVYLLSDAVETRSNETGNHVRRVAAYARELALLCGLAPEEANLLRAAAPLHDVGKIGIPDAVLNKPRELDEGEWDVMKTHTHQGARILDHSRRPILQAAAIIAEQHHENWDGSGYPKGLQGEEIHLYGRIVALADVFDALGSERCYKQPWEMNQVVDYLLEERGKKFDPNLLDLFLNNMRRFTEIHKRFPD